MAENWLEMVEKRPFTFRELAKSEKKLSFLCAGQAFTNFLPFFAIFCHFLPLQDMHLPIVAKEQKEDRIKILVDYFSSNRNNHTFYAIKVGD